MKSCGLTGSRGGNCEGISGGKINNILMLAGMRVPHAHVHSLMHLRASRDIAYVVAKQVLAASVADVALHATGRQEEINARATAARAAPQAAPSSALVSPSNNQQLSPCSATATTTGTTEPATTTTAVTEPATEEAAPFIATNEMDPPAFCDGFSPGGSHSGDCSWQARTNASNGTYALMDGNRDVDGLAVATVVVFTRSAKKAEMEAGARKYTSAAETVDPKGQEAALDVIVRNGGKVKFFCTDGDTAAHKSI